MFHPRASQVLYATSILAIFACPAHAQSNVGRISGVVTDASGAAVPGAKVDARNVSTKISQSAQTDDAGLYVFPNLVAGTYDLHIEHQGFRSTESPWP